MLGLTTKSAFASHSAFVPKAPKEVLSVGLAEMLGGGQAFSLELPRPQNYQAMERKYGSSAWVYICCRKKARDLASAPIQVMRRSGEKQTPVEQSHPLVQLFRHVNPHMTMVHLLQITSLYLDLTGNAFWLIARDTKGIPREIYPINPFMVRIFGTESAVVDHYVVNHFGRLYPFRAYKPGQVGDIVHFSLTNPTSDLQSSLPSVWGVGPLEAAWTLVVTDEDTVKWNRNMVKNDGRPAGILTSDQPVTQTDSQAAAEEYRKVFGGPQGVGKVLVLGKNLKYERVAVTPKEMDYKEARVALREEILAVFGMNSAVLGLAQGDIGRRDESHKEYWQGTIVATSQSDVCPPLTEFLGGEFGSDIEVQQDFSNVRALQENEQERVETAKSYHGMGISFSRLNKRFKLGFDDDPNDTQGYLPVTMVPVEMLEEVHKPVEPAPIVAPGSTPGKPPEDE